VAKKRGAAAPSTEPKVTPEKEKTPEAPKKDESVVVEAPALDEQGCLAAIANVGVFCEKRGDTGHREWDMAVSSLKEALKPVKVWLDTLCDIQKDEIRKAEKALRVKKEAEEKAKKEQEEKEAAEAKA
jgi:hypothetical protein